LYNKVGINSEVFITSNKGGKISIEKKQKWELISSHTARRSFATNMYLTRRMTLAGIMAITGHTTEKSFFRYIKISDEDKVKQIAQDTFFKF